MPDATGPNARILDNSLLDYQWRLESTMVWIRWLVVPFFLVPVLVVPRAFTPMIALLAVSLALVNLWFYKALQQPNAVRLHQARRWSPVLEWGVTLGILLACAPAPSTAAPAVLLILMGIAGRREGVGGLLRATVGANVSVAGLVVLQVLVLHTLRPEQAWLIVALWEMVLLVAGLVLGRLEWIQEVWWRQETERREDEHLVFQRLHAGLSFRESEVLSLLVREDLTYDQIARILSIGPEAVKTHVHRLGQKLGVAGRKEIIAETRARGLLPRQEK